MELIVLGVERVNILRLEQAEPYLKVVVQALPLPDDTGPEVEALHHEVMELAAKAIALVQPQAPQELAGCWPAPRIRCGWPTCWPPCSAWTSARNRRCSKPRRAPKRCG